MSDECSLSRRDFLRSAGAIGAGSLLAGANVFGQAGDTKPASQGQQAVEGQVVPVPTRPFGDTRADVPILSLGGMFDVLRNQLVLKQAYKWGITCWETAHSYGNGNSELGMGMYLEANPSHRRDLFLVTKASTRDAAGLTRDFQTSLERLKTDYVDLYLIHGVAGPDEFTKWAAEWRAWAEKAKAEKKIRFFGFSTHSNMPENLQAASKLGYIDGIMTSYNFRIMNTDEMKAAVDACAKAGIGLVAMKSQAGKSRGATTQTKEEEAELALVDRFVKRGFSDRQAQLKAVWENPRIATICVLMQNLTVLQSNYRAALDKTALSAADKDVLHRYAQATRASYCAGCSRICQTASGGLPVSEVMRFLMYYNDYGMTDHARKLFAELPASIRRQLAQADYWLAQRRCPQGMAIAEMMRQAAEILA